MVQAQVQKVASQCQKKSKIFKLSIFLIKFHDFSFYDIQYTFLLFRHAASGISAWTTEWKMHCHTFKKFLVARSMIAFSSYSQKTESHIFLQNFLHLFCHILRIFSSPLLLFFFTTFSHSCSLHVCFVSLSFSSRTGFFFYVCKKRTDFFFRINSTLGITTSTALLKMLSRLIKNFLMRCS